MTRLKASSINLVQRELMRSNGMVRTFVYTSEIISNYARVVIGAETEALQQAVLAYKGLKPTRVMGQSAGVQTSDTAFINNPVWNDHSRSSRRMP